MPPLQLSFADRSSQCVTMYIWPDATAYDFIPKKKNKKKKNSLGIYVLYYMYSTYIQQFE